MSITIDQAIERVHDDRRERQDYLVPFGHFQLKLNDSGEIVARVQDREFRPNDWALRQMAMKMDVPTTMVKKLTAHGRDVRDRELLVSIFQNGARDGRVDPEKNFRFRTYSDGTLRAFLTEKYAIVDNVWCLEQLKKAFPNDELMFDHFRGDADNIYGNMRIPGADFKSDDSEYGGSIFVRNSEIGNGRVAVAPGIWRQICTNGMMGWAPAWSKVHLGEIDLASLSAEILGGISKAIPHLREGFDLMIAAKQRVLQVDPSAMIAEVAIKHKLEANQAMQTLDAYGTHESSFRSLFGIVNAITRVAQKQKVDAEQFRLEEIGGQLCKLSDASWSRLNTLAGGLSQAERDKAYGIVTVAG